MSGAARGGRSGIAAYVLVCALVPLVLDAGTGRLLGEALLMLAMAQMWNLLAGYTGLVSIGHQVFVGVGAYALFVGSDSLGISPYAAIPLAGLAGGLLALLIAPLLFRLRDAYFSIGMWVLAEILRLLVSKSSTFGGTSGLALRSVQRIDVGRFAQLSFYICAAIALAAMVGMHALLRSRFGLALMTVRDNELAAASIGVDVGRNRLVAFTLSGFGCALAGATHYMTAMFVGPDAAFGVDWVVAMLFIAIIGGIGTLEGPVIGTILYFGLREFFATWFEMSGGWYLVALGVMAVVTMQFAPQGIWGLLRDRYDLGGLDVRRRPPAHEAGGLGGP
jgi:branched-chain amino acid transport system permease protein